MSKWTDELQGELVVAVANVLQAHGLHPSDAAETEGWTTEMVEDFAVFMRRQVDAIAEVEIRS